MLSDREWLLMSPLERELLWELRSIKAAAWSITVMLASTLIAVGLAILLHL